MRHFFGALTIGWLFAVTASASIMTFDTLAEFEGAAGPTMVEDFDGVPGERNFTNRSVQIGDLTLFTDLNSTDDLASFNRVLIGPGYNDLDDFQRAASKNSIDRTSNFAHVGIRPGDVFTISFNQPMYSFGGSLKGLNDSIFRTRISVLGQNFVPAITDGPKLQFFGIVSETPFSSISFRGPERNGFGLDNLRYSSLEPPSADIPVPASLPLLATGLLLVGAFRRKRNAAL